MVEYDNHTILIKHPSLTTQQLEDLISAKISNFYLNNVKEGSLGIAYLFVPDPQDYFSLLGREQTVMETVESEATSHWADSEVVTKTIKIEPTIVFDQLKVQAAFAYYPDEEFKANVLFCPVVPDNVTIKDIEKVFNRFVTVPISMTKKKRSLIVTFPEGTYAAFALHMCKQIYIKGQFLSFKHARY